MKKAKLFAAALSLVLALSACGDTGTSDDSRKETVKKTTTSAKVTESEESAEESEEEPEEEPEEEKKEKKEKEPEPEPTIPTAAAGWPDDSLNPYVFDLSEGYTDENGYYHLSQGDLYRNIIEMFDVYANRSDFGGFFTDEDFQVAFRQSVDSRPDVFWMDNVYYHISPQGEASFDLTSYPGTDLYAAPAMHDELIAKADEIAALAAEQPTDYEKILFVHDYIAEHTMYAATAINTQRNYAYGCLVEGASACNGYSKAFQLVMQRMGIFCGLVYGEADGPHTWNYVWFNGNYYWVDVTWDDHDGWVTGHDYFMCTDDEILTDRELYDYNLELPKCSTPLM
ncbi:transglutaminase domain-containing protein [Ruminococcus sp.]|uniref:transglutaminase domain-containing protein n=1 Tax=Ruminococcus sp. TaxID=41978 RepID=UPI0025DA3794|nr:transglutaminase domain-containing protein [Ruminococcus sp.]MBQ8965635.1 hypothetical protein [Ruminococcus sp.]